jgi:hypothetical protein
MSVPVLQKTGNKYYGFLDIADIVKFFVERFGEQQLKSLSDNFWTLIDKDTQFQQIIVNDLMSKIYST